MSFNSKQIIAASYQPPSNTNKHSNAKNLLSYNDYKGLLIKRRQEGKENRNLLELEKQQKQGNEPYRTIDSDYLNSSNPVKNTAKKTNTASSNIASMKKPQFQAYKIYLQTMKDPALENKLISDSNKFQQHSFSPKGRRSRSREHDHFKVSKPRNSYAKGGSPEKPKLKEGAVVHPHDKIVNFSALEQKVNYYNYINTKDKERSPKVKIGEVKEFITSVNTLDSSNNKKKDYLNQSRSKEREREKQKNNFIRQNTKSLSPGRKTKDKDLQNSKNPNDNKLSSRFEPELNFSSNNDIVTEHSGISKKDIKLRDQNEEEKIDEEIKQIESEMVKRFGGSNITNEEDEKGRKDKASKKGKKD